MSSRIKVFFSGAALVFFGSIILFGGSRPAGFLRVQVGRVIQPLATAAGRTGVWIGFVTEGFSAERIRMLEDDSRRLAALGAELEALEKENGALRAALGIKNGFGVSARGARVLAYQNMLGRESLMIDVGKEAGVGEGDVVIDARRLLVGEIQEAGNGFSKVVIASNPGATFSGELLPLGGKILVRGLGARAFSLELIPNDTLVRDGDFVLWTREDQRSAPAIFAGRISPSPSPASGAFKTGRASLLSDPEMLERVIVLTRP